MLSVINLRLIAFVAVLVWLTPIHAEPALSASVWKHESVSSAVEGSTLVGALRVAHSDTRSSGGFSALWVSPDCATLITISDYSQALPWGQSITRSGWFQARIAYAGAGVLVGLTELGSGQVVGTNGETIPGAIEAMAWDGRGFLISFDDRAEIYHYAGATPDGALLSQVPEIAFQGPDIAQGNRGLESLAVLTDGRVFALWEKPDGAGVATAWLMDPNALDSVAYRAALNPGGATTLADGSVVVVERDFLGRQLGTRVRLVRLSHADLQSAAAVIDGTVLYDATSPRLDNFEGVAACRKGEREFLFAISDNNGDWSRALRGRNPQETLLVMFDVGATDTP